MFGIKVPKLFPAFGWSTRRQFYQQVSAQIENGRALTDVLSDYRDRLLRRNRTAKAMVVDEFVKKVRNGDTLADAMGDCLTHFERGLLSVGERTGKIGAAMRYILDTKDREARIMSTLRGSMMSPVVYIVTLIITLYIIGHTVVPQLESILPVEKWKGMARLMYLLGQVATGWGSLAALILVILLIVLIWYSFPRWVGKQRDFCDKHIFPFTTYQETAGFSWLIAFMAMIRAGVPDERAIDDQAKTATQWMASRLIPIRLSLRNGCDLYEALNKTPSRFPSQDLIDEVGAYVAFPDFSEKMLSVVSTYSDNFEAKMKSMSVWVGSIISALMFIVIIIIQFGANDLSSQVSATMTRGG